MSRNVFISFLGTNDYLATHYRFDNGHVSDVVRFVQEAVIKEITSDWTETDAIYIYMTSGSRMANWEDDGQGENKPRKGLKSRLNDLGLKPSVVDVDIPEGFSESEIWKIFDAVYSNLQDDDKIYFDVTHAFRSIPLFSAILFNYASFMKGITLESVVYGAFEKLGPSWKVKKDILEEDRIAPVIDMTSMIKLQQYTEIASGLVTFGRIDQIGTRKIASDDRNTVYSKPLMNLYKALNRFDNALISNNLEEFKKGLFYKDYKEALSSLEQFGDAVPKPMVELFQSLDGNLSEFSFTECWNNVDVAIKWATDYEMLPLAYTLARESISYRIAEIFSDYNPYGEDKLRDYKDFISKVCSIKDSVIARHGLTGDLKTYENVVHKLLDEDIIRQIRKFGYYRTISENRNTINHGKGVKTYKELCQAFEDAYNGCLSIIKGSKIDRVFLNLSSHPSSDWSEAQLNAAKNFGRVVDMDFPSVQPDCDEMSIQRIVDDYVDRIFKNYSQRGLTVHIMGEMTFTYAMVERLKAEGIECLASTTERIAETLPDGRKISSFNFVRFRSY